MPTNTYDTIRAAIVAKQQVVATYNGFTREMSPHAIGRKNGAEQALFFQFGGDSSKGPITHDDKNNWRCLTLSSLRDVEVRDGEFHTFDNHSRQSTCLDSIDLQVTF